MTDDCLFCSIVAGDVLSDIVAETDHSVAFTDANPQAPTHVLVVPRVHQPDIGSLAEAEPDATIDLLLLARRIAEGVGGSYRLVFNTGADANQTVFHCHAHVLAGRTFGWPPG